MMHLCQRSCLIRVCMYIALFPNHIDCECNRRFLVDCQLPQLDIIHSNVLSYTQRVNVNVTSVTCTSVYS